MSHWHYVIDLSAFRDGGLYPINAVASPEEVNTIIISSEVIKQMRQARNQSDNYQRVLHFLSTYILPHSDNMIQIDTTRFVVSNYSTIYTAERYARNPGRYAMLVVSDKVADNFADLTSANVLPLAGRGALPWRGWFEYHRIPSSRYDVRADIRQCYNVIMPRRYVAISHAHKGMCELRFYHGQVQFGDRVPASAVVSRILEEYLRDKSVRMLFAGAVGDDYDKFGRIIVEHERSHFDKVIGLDPIQTRKILSEKQKPPIINDSTCFIIGQAQNLSYAMIKRLYGALDRIAYGTNCRIVFLYHVNAQFEADTQVFARDYAMHDRIATIEESSVGSA